MDGGEEEDHFLHPKRSTRIVFVWLKLSRDINERLLDEAREDGRGLGRVGHCLDGTVIRPRTRSLCDAEHLFL